MHGADATLRTDPHAALVGALAGGLVAQLRSSARGDAALQGVANPKNRTI